MRYESLLCMLLLSLALPARSASEDLIINSVSPSAQSVVYDLQDDADRADAVRYVGEMRDRFRAKAQIIDAAALDEAALRGKLKGDFILYTTIGSRLFKAATQPLGIRIEGDKLVWKGVSTPVGEARIILVGKNPYGSGYSTIYAANSNRLVVGMNGLFHGPCSYHFFQGDRLLKEGRYGEDFVEKSDRIPKAQAVEDVQQFFSTLQRVHPDLLAKVDIKDYIALKQKTLQGVADKLDKDGTIAVADLAYLLYYAATFFQDGHTSVQWQFRPNDANCAGKRFPPFLLAFDNGRFVVADSVDKSVLGQEVLSIDGKPVREFLRPILDRCSGEILAFKMARFTGNQAFWYGFSGLLSTSSIKLKLRDADGKQTERSVEAVSLADFQKLSDKSLAQRRQRFMKGTQIRFLDSDRVAYFTYPTFKYSDDEKKKVDDVFRQIKSKGARDLIIDIRGNGGGSSNMGDYIFTYLYDGKFRPFSLVRAKLSSDVLSSVGKNLPVPADAGVDGLVVRWKADDQSHPKPEAFFAGRTVLLVDNGVFSSATDFAAMFRDYGVGKIIGYETGGLPNCFGDIYSFELKNSGIPCGVSWKQFFGPKPRPGDDEHGVLPDIPMNDKVLQDFRKEDDPVLAFTLDHIRKTRPAK